MGIEVLVAAAVVGTGASIYSSEKARKEQKSARRAQDRIRQVQESRQRMSAVRENIINQAQIQQAGATMGAQDSSLIQGSLAASGSATSGNIQFINQISDLQQSVSSAMSKASNYGSQAGNYAGVANLAMQGAAMLGSPTKSASQSVPQGSMSNAGSQSSSVARGPFSNPLPPSPFKGI